MLLRPADPPPVRITDPEGASPFLLIGDHAGRLIPSVLGTLGLREAERHRHIAWDIGIAALGARLAAALGATFVEQRYSRLVVDCNRAPGQPGLMPAISDGTLVPANRDLSDEAAGTGWPRSTSPTIRRSRALSQGGADGEPFSCRSTASRP